jgi:hypothetical protein
MKFMIALTLLALGASAPPDPQPAMSFREVSISVGKGPKCIALADVNHDGKVDLLVGNADDDTLSVLLGDGRGNFQQASGSPFPAGHNPNDMVVGDMNSDGNLDLVIANQLRTRPMTSTPSLTRTVLLLEISMGMGNQMSLRIAGARIKSSCCLVKAMERLILAPTTLEWVGDHTKDCVQPTSIKMGTPMSSQPTSMQTQALFCWETVGAASTKLLALHFLVVPSPGKLQ